MQKFMMQITTVKNRLLFPICLAVILIILMMIIKIYHADECSRTQLLGKVAEINHHFLFLFKQLEEKPVATPEQINALHQQLDLIQQYLPKLNSNDEIKQLEELISVNNKAILNKLELIQKHSEVLKNKATKKQYLSPKKLPFKVISVDVWNDRPEVTIDADEGYRLIGLDEFYRGWTLTDVSFDPAYAVFQNSQKNRVKVRF